MKKLFISCPMKNRSEENIRMTFDRLHKIAEAVYGESLEVIPTYIEDNPPKCRTEGLWYLGRASNSSRRLIISSVFAAIMRGCITAALWRLTLQSFMECRFILSLQIFLRLM